MSDSVPRRRVVPSLDGLWAMIAVALPLAVTFMGRTQAIDLTYQIRAGQIMLDTRSVLDVDTFTYTVQGQPWLNQQWGAQVLLALAYRAGGWFGLNLLRGALVAITVFFVYRSCRAIGASPRSSALLTVGGWFVGIQIVSMLRPQQFGFVLFAACLWVITTRRDHPRRVWLVPLLVIPWVNLHGSFPLVFLLLGLAWLEDRHAEPARARQLLFVGVASVLATMLSPYGPRVWSYVWDLSTHPIVSRRVSEWGPPSIHTTTGQLFFLSLLLVVLYLGRRATAVGWIALMSVAIYALLSLLAIRGVVWWALATPVVVAGLIRDDVRPRPPSHSPINAVLVITLVGLIVVALSSTRGTDPASGGPALLTHAPERLVAAIRPDVSDGSRVFVSQLFASWTEFSAPQLLVDVDSRIEIFPETVWDDYFVISTGQEGWHDLVDGWGVQALILENDQAKGLLEVLEHDPGWTVVGRTEDGSAYVRS